MKGARSALLLLIVALPVGKWVQLEFHPGEDPIRQAILVSVTLVAVVAVVPLSRVAEAVLGWHVALPRPLGSVLGEDWRWARLLLGILIVAADVALGVAVISKQSRLDIGVRAGAALVLSGLLALWEIRRGKAAASNRARPDRAVLWTVMPVTLLWAVSLLLASVIGHGLDPTLGVEEESCSVGASGNAGHALCTALVIGFGEEYLYRGLLLVLAVKARLDQFGMIATSIAFGLWHAPDALSGPEDLPERLLLAVGVTLGTFALGHLILMPLRLRSRSLAGPALLHAGNNLLLKLW